MNQKKLFKLIPAILQKSIDLGGSSISDFVHTNGVKGEMQNFFSLMEWLEKNVNTVKQL